MKIEIVVGIICAAVVFIITSYFDYKIKVMRYECPQKVEMTK